MQTQSSAPESTVDDDFSPAFYRERLLVEAEMRGFSPAEAQRLVFLMWLDGARNLEHVVRKG